MVIVVTSVKFSVVAAVDLKKDFPSNAAVESLVPRESDKHARASRKYTEFTYETLTEFPPSRPIRVSDDPVQVNLHTNYQGCISNRE